MSDFENQQIDSFDFFESVWEQREEEIYPQYFGKSDGSIATIPMNFFDPTQMDPLWVSYGSMKFHPQEDRNTYVYITSGLSNTFDDRIDDCDPDSLSGYGIEIAIQTAKDEKWGAILANVLMAYALEGFEKSEDFVLFYGNTLKLNINILNLFGMNPTVTHVMFIYPKSFEHSFSLLSGKVNILNTIGLTKTEYSYLTSTEDGRSERRIELLEKIKESTQNWELMDPFRKSVI